MKYDSYVNICEEMFDNTSDLCSSLKFGTPWVEAILVYLRKSNYHSSASKLFIDIVSDFEEISDESKVIYNGHFMASRLPLKEEVEVAYSLKSSVNEISSMIFYRMQHDGCDCTNALSRESHIEIFKSINFEISSPINIYYLLGYPFLDNRGKERLYGITKNDDLRLIRKLENGEAMIVDMNESGTFASDLISQLSNLF